MAGRYLTVNERCLWTLQKRLTEITVENDYPLTVNRVWRKDGNHIAAQNPPEIFIYRLGVTNAPVSTNSTDDRINEIQRVEIRFFPARSPQIDREYAIMFGAIQKCLPHEKNGALVDPFYSQGHIWLRPLTSQAFYSPTEMGSIMGRAVWEMKYHYMASNSYLWDSMTDQQGIPTGSAPVSEEQMPWFN